MKYRFLWYLYENDYRIGQASTKNRMLQMIKFYTRVKQESAYIQTEDSIKLGKYEARKEQLI